MGFLDKHREEKAAKAARSAEIRAQLAAQEKRDAAAQALADWEEDDEELRDLLDAAKNFDGGTDDVELNLKKGERAYMVMQGSALIEPRRLPGQWQGRSSGYSFHVAKRVNYRIGATRGTYVQGEEKPQVIDEGTTTITNQRVVFQGTKASREWSFAKLLGWQHVDIPGEWAWSAIQVSNRQKVSGFAYTDEVADEVQFRLSLALATFNGDRDRIVDDVTKQLEEHAATRPASVAALPATPEPEVAFVPRRGLSPSS
jgi:hypothetical protein